MPVLTIMLGISGSGKSTWVAANKGNAVVASADSFFVGPDGAYRFDPRKLGEAHEACAFLVAVSLAKGLDVIVDNTNARWEDLNRYIGIAGRQGAKWRVVHLDCDPEIAHKRNLHGVPLSTIQRQAAQIQRTLARVPPSWRMTIRGA